MSKIERGACKHNTYDSIQGKVPMSKVQLCEALPIQQRHGTYSRTREPRAQILNASGADRVRRVFERRAHQLNLVDINALSILCAF